MSRRIADSKAMQHHRLRKVNALLTVIASTGRRFFHHAGRISYVEMDARMRVFFVDKYCQRRFDTHQPHSHWRHFSEGGTLRALVQSLRDFIKTGCPLRYGFGPWPDDYCRGDLWGYGDDMVIVRSVARTLGILAGLVPE